jgi:hypothetical protein
MSEIKVRVPTERNQAPAFPNADKWPLPAQTKEAMLQQVPVFAALWRQIVVSMRKMTQTHLQ